MTAIAEPAIHPVEALPLLGYEPADTPRRVRGGWDTLLWRFHGADGDERSLRVHVLPDAEAIAQRETIALTALAESGFPAPRVEIRGTISNCPAAVLSWCPGGPLMRLIEKRPWWLPRLSRLFGRIQAQIHAIPAPAGLPGPEEWTRQVPAGYEDLAEQVRLLEPAGSALIHMDYHPLNVISDGTRITGVVDWGGAAAGDPRADLARTEMTILTAPIPPGPFRVMFGALRGTMLRSWRAGYAEIAGTVPEFRGFSAWAGATLLLEVERVVGREGVWGDDRYLDQLRQWIAEHRVG